jgi:ABC-2 type transport system ATP-binding protein
MGTDAVIQVAGVTKQYGDHVAVDDLSFELKRGEIFAFLGPNGAGKTTTMRMILDILKPDRGTIEIFGMPISDDSKNRIGYMPEERGLYRNVPLLDLLSYLGSLKGMATSDAKQRAKDLLQKVELGDYLDKKVSELSKGMQQKVQFVLTILHRPELIVVDEPFSGLDPVNTQVLKDMVFELADEGTTILMSTHMMHQVEEMGDRLLMIDHGRRVLYGPVDEVRDRFAHNAVIVQGEGDWTALPGVTQVDAHGDNHDRHILHLAENATPDDLMRQLASSSSHRVRSFTLAVPSLNEIFIEVAGGNNSYA